MADKLNKQLYSGSNAIVKAVGDPNKKATATTMIGDPNKKATAQKLTNPVSPVASGGNLYSYDAFEKAARESGLYDSFSDADLRLAQSNPDAGMSILQHKKDYASAATPEAKQRANQGAEATRRQFGYTGGTDGSKFYATSSTQPASGVYADPMVKAAMDTLNQVNAGKPGEFSSAWADTADSYLSQYQNRDPFSYDFNTDALYNQYKDSYIQQGQMAMMDTMGQAAAMTGGYGNSYAQSVGQQVYNQHLNQLNDVIPQLQQMAYDRYQQEGQDLLNQYNIAMDRYNLDYGQYQDNLSNWWQEVGVATDAFNTAVGNAQWQNSFDYGKERDAVADSQWQTGMDYQKGRDAIADEQWNQQWAAEQESINLDNQLKKIQIGQLTAKPSGGGGGGGGGKPSYEDLTWEEIQQLTDIFSGAETTEDLAALANLYGNGFNPDQINAIIDYAAGDLVGLGNTGADTKVPLIGFTAGVPTTPLNSGTANPMVEEWLKATGQIK